MDGDVAPLDKIYEVSSPYETILMVDDAHGEGVLGKGKGIVSHFGLEGQFDVEIGTLSKAFGVMGGVIAGKKVVIDYLRQKARPFLFSSAVVGVALVILICMMVGSVILWDYGAAPAFTD